MSARVRLAVPEITDDLTASSFAILWRHIREGSQDAIDHLEPVWPILATIGGQFRGRPILEWLERCLRREGSEDRQINAMTAIACIGPNAGTLKNCLLSILAVALGEHNFSGLRVGWSA